MTSQSARRMKRFVLVLLAACAPAPKAAPVAPEQAATFLKDIAADEASRTSLSGEGTVTLSQNGVPLKGELTVAASDSRVRLDVAADSGQTLFALASDGETVTLLDFKNRSAARGPAATTALASAGLEGFTAPALADLLLAHLPCAQGREVSAVNTIHVAHCLGGELTATYSARQDKSGYFLSHITWSKLSAQLLAHNSAGFARRIEISTPSGKAVVSLSEVDSNVPVSTALFQLNIPPGLRFAP